MHKGRNTLSFLRSGPGLGRCAIAIAFAAGCAGAALAQGGQTEIVKTAPSSPPPAAAPIAPAPVAPAPQAAAPAKPASPVGGAPASWRADLAQPPQAQAPQTAAAPVADSDLEIVQKINGYFNGMTNLSGAFVQTDPDTKQKRGKFYMARPGKVRFAYAAPSQLKIISDGQYLAIEDHDLNTTDRYPIDMTPFRLLLSETVDLMKDANILAVEQGDNDIVITLEDRKGGGSGRIRLFFNKADMSLKEWTITDAQGLDTRIQVANLEQNKQLAPELFEFSKTLGFKNSN
jgi:outer membrane lipoprotein-sorting protein